MDIAPNEDNCKLIMPVINKIDDKFIMDDINFAKINEDVDSAESGKIEYLVD